jgi:threonine dehydratase
MTTTAPAIESLRQLKKQLAGHIVETPVVRCAAVEERLGAGSEVWAKLEFLQQTGTFKARGALAVVLSLGEEQRRAGVTAVSAGNHAIATAYAAKVVGTSAKVVMLGSSNPARVERCRSFGAEVVIVDDVHSAFAVAEDIQQQEGRYFVHPFEGPETFRGTATIGLEVCEQVPDFDAIIIPIGGGGLCAGISSAVKQLRPDVSVFGVEPEGADSMRRSFASGKPEPLERVNTIADSLGAPFALEQSFELCRDNVDELVVVDDDALKTTMGFLFKHMKIAVEPACAATTAALLGPLADRLRGSKVVCIMCGSNIDWGTFARHAKFD